MNKAEELVSSEAVGANIQFVEVNGTMYPVKPPTINRVAGAVACLSGLALNDGKTIRDVLNIQENAREAFGMISPRSFSIAASLTKSASALVARSCR